jgi:hypothetical protein
MKFIGLILASLVGGYILGEFQWARSHAHLMLWPWFITGLMPLPLLIEMVVKSRRRKIATEVPLQISKVSGYLFVSCMVIFALSVGFVLRLA